MSSSRFGRVAFWKNVRRHCVFLIFVTDNAQRPALCDKLRGNLKHWVQQNHDGLPQKAGFPQKERSKFQFVGQDTRQHFLLVYLTRGYSNWGPFILGSGWFRTD